MSVIPKFEPKRAPGVRTVAALRGMLTDTPGLRRAFKRIATMRPDFREAVLLDLLEHELRREKPRRTFVCGIYRRYAEVRREREQAALLGQFGG